MRLRRALFLALLALVTTAGVVYATFSASLVASGTTNETEIRAFVKAVKEMRQIGNTQVRVLDVTLTDSAGTGWHTHPGTPSLVIAKTGDMNYLAPDGRGGCTTRLVRQGDMIFHPSSVHDLRPVGASAVFTVIYFSAPGVTLTESTGPPC